VLVGMVVMSGAIAVVPGSTRLRGGLKRRVRCWDAAGLIATDLIAGCCSEGGMLPLPPLARDGEEECSSS